METGALPAYRVETTLALIGDKWKVLILRDLMGGAKRFGELKRSIGGVSQKVLTDQLRAMEESGLVGRKVYAEVPPRVEYSLTGERYSLKPILDAMWAWAWRTRRSRGNKAGPDGALADAPRPVFLHPIGGPRRRGGTGENAPQANGVPIFIRVSNPRHNLSESAHIYPNRPGHGMILDETKNARTAGKKKGEPRFGLPTDHAAVRRALRAALGGVRHLRPQAV